MNSEKEAEYIAEIVRLKFELKKSQIFIGKDILSSNKDLLLVANQCIGQLSKNTGNKVKVNLDEHETMPLQTCVAEYHYHLSAEITNTTKI